MGRRRNTEAKVYETKHATSPWLVYLSVPGKKPIRKHFSDKESAEKARDKMNQAVALEGVHGVVFGADARAEWTAAHRLLEPYGVTVLEAARAYVARQPSTIGMDFLEAIHAFVDSKRRANRRPDTLREAENRLKEFRTFSIRPTVDAVTAQDCREYLGRAHLSPASVKRYQAVLGNFFKYCRGRGWMVEDPLTGLDAPTIDAKEPVILTVKQAAQLMNAAAGVKEGRIVKALALRLFAGLRPGEQEALRDEDIQKTSIRVGTGKIRGRRAVRIVPMSAALKAWLKAFPNAPIKPSNFRKLQDEAIDKAGLRAVWCPDILRHTWISYRLAETNDDKKTAREAGNSADIIYRHYFQLVTQKEGRLFAKMTPDSLNNGSAILKKRASGRNKGSV